MTTCKGSTFGDTERTGSLITGGKEYGNNTYEREFGNI